ncbi:ATP-dependent DNA helicase RecG [Candidatus Kinetoplastibacterium oncopeltii TCC290E]|uniref:Probable DNA 3'-5' helicase RecG n=1 Tax=Candidatus Kinetoplastidibacterium stringomonadis TCC290E TaxID=1208920 RepID=M1LWA6_9PROT|nr:ATP-dependent DNA helicase RecG [Candidatus Kinetoplastibacterium oncopeltii]AGF48346.1 ATP-dependent DNA helicase RecG [Candidatus Kinetoplastibacterium oncopeltii TCC290E]
MELNEQYSLILHMPFRYENETAVTKIETLQQSSYSIVDGIIRDVYIKYHNKKKNLIVILTDGSGDLQLRWINFYDSYSKQFIIGEKIRIGGEVRKNFLLAEIVHPKVYNYQTNLPKFLTPIYPSIKGISQLKIRKNISEIINNQNIYDTLPDDIIKSFNLMTFSDAIKIIHRPSVDISVNSLLKKTHPAWFRIKFDELLANQLSLEISRNNRKKNKSRSLKANKEFWIYVRNLIDITNIDLTNAQKRAVKEISFDLTNNYPMYRLLQGDVGSGKTIVAVIAALQAIINKTQVAIMTPTEILAEQHFSKINIWFSTLGINTELITSSKSIRERNIIKDSVLKGNTSLIIGTQSLIQEYIKFKELGLSIIDEEHRFGVEQRSSLYKKGFESGNEITYPHLLSMSATPIPRTLAMTFLSDMDVSIIDELPKNRKPIITKLISNDRREKVLMHVVTAVRSGNQAYWVCPLVQNTEKNDLQNAVNTFHYIKDKFTDLNIGLIHSNISSHEKLNTMKSFRDGNLDILVATTVIEVGVDIPNASMMIIDHAERFGLAQLHQLRGRIGRGDAESICVLLYKNLLSEVAKYRLKAMFETSDGFEIARRDLKIRGPGDFLGTKQSGINILKFCDLENDTKVIELANRAASIIYNKYPEFVEKHLERWHKITIFSQ